MTDPEIDYKLPASVSLLLPDSYEVAKPGRLRIASIDFELPWSSCETHVARHRHAGKRRLPREQRILVRRRHRMFLHPLLAVHGAGSKQQTIVGDERNERVARVLILRHLRECLLSFHHLLQR